MNWICAICGSASRTNRKRCKRCGKIQWKPNLKKELIEVSGPMRRIAPKGLLISPNRPEGLQDFNTVKCGRCHAVIYVPDREFNKLSFKEAMKRHYSLSPECRENSST
jgi:hypothetical protein